MKKDIFVSLVIDVASAISNEQIKEYSELLENEYSSHEILICDRSDYLRDRIEDVLKRVPGIRYIRFSGELDGEVSLSAGMENAIGDIIVLSTPDNLTPEALARGVEACCAGNDLVAGCCGKRMGVSLPLLPIARMIGYRQCQGDTGLRVISRRLAISAMTPANFHHMLYYRLARTAPGIERMEYQARARMRLTFRDLMRLATYTSTALLRFVNGIALCTSFIAMLVAGYTVAAKLLMRGVIEGWTTTMFTLSFFFVVLFLVLTVMGEYMMRLIVLSSSTASYHIVQERHSSVMLDTSALNVKEESENNTPNLVQTGRDR